MKTSNGFELLPSDFFAWMFGCIVAVAVYGFLHQVIGLNDDTAFHLGLVALVVSAVVGIIRGRATTPQRNSDE